MAHVPPNTFQSASLYVGDLLPEVSESVLFDFFTKVGPVATVRVCRDSITRRSLGYAYVNFQNVGDAELVLDTLNFAEINGKPCRLMWSQRDPSLRKTGLGNVYVNNLAPTIDNKDLYDTFSVFGNILSCKVAQDEKGNSKGYGYVHFETAEAAQEAISKLDGMIVEDLKVSIAHFVRRQDRSSTNKWTNLYVKHFPRSWSMEQFKAIFEPFGTVQNAFLAQGYDNQNKGYGFVNFESHEAAAKAVEALKDHKIEGDGLVFNFYVVRAQKKMERERELKIAHESLKLERISRQQTMNLYVKNIADTVTDAMFEEAFGACGRITSARIMREDNDAKTSKGFGFVCYASAEEAAKAVAEMNNKMLAGKPLFVTYYQRQDARRQQMAASYAPQMRFGNGMNMPPFQMFQQPFPQPQRGAMPYFNPNMPRGAPFRGNFPAPYAQPGQAFPVGFPPRNRTQGGAPRGVPRPMFAAPQMQQMAPRGYKFTAQARNQGPVGGVPAAPIAQQPTAVPAGKMDFSQALLATTDPMQQKNMIGEKLYPLIYSSQPELAGKITGMLLEMDNAELINLIESPEALTSKIEEALAVLRSHVGDN